MELRGVGWWAPIQQKITKESEMKFITLRFWRRSYMRKTRQECKHKERPNVGYMPLLWSKGGIFWSSLPEARLINSNKKMQNFGMLPKSSFFFLPKGVQGKGPPWETGATVYNKDIWGIMSESYSYLWLLGCYLGYVFRGGVSISLRSMQIRDR